MKRKMLFGLAIISILTIPNVNFGQSPDFGSASSYALFTSVGAFNNLGDSYITGDVGTNVGAFTGFPPGTVTGETHVADAVSAQVALDLEKVYNYLKGLTCGEAISITLGNAQILTPNIYCLGEASTLNGELILDAQGNANAVFIFQIDGAFSAAASSKITLANSASACNVYWQVNGQFDLLDNSDFTGNVVNNGAVNLMENSSVFGRVLSIAGAVSPHNSMITLCTKSEGQLPIGLLNFSANQSGEKVQIDWSTATETNNDYFTNQRSQDGITFDEVLKMNGAGNSNTILNYSAIDTNPYDGISYYRLMQTDFDGKSTFSNPVVVDFIKSNSFQIYPNPFTNSTTLILRNDESLISNCDLTVIDVYGKTLIYTHITDQSTRIETNRLPSGIYFYNIFGNNKILKSGKLISQ